MYEKPLTFYKVTQQHLDSARSFSSTPQHVRCNHWVSFKLLGSLLGKRILSRCPSALPLCFSLTQPCSLASCLVVWYAGACERWSSSAGKTLRRSMREELAEKLRSEWRVHCRRRRSSRMRRDGGRVLVPRLSPRECTW